MNGKSIKDYAGDLRGILIFWAIVIVAVIWNLDYLFGEKTMDEVKVVEKKELSKPVVLSGDKN
jgi:hypothetical protein